MPWGKDRRLRMIIKEVNIGKFGKLENQKYQFAPRINVIYGANESRQKHPVAVSEGDAVWPGKNKGEKDAGYL